MVMCAIPPSGVPARIGPAFVLLQNFEPITAHWIARNRSFGSRALSSRMLLEIAARASLMFGEKNDKRRRSLLQLQRTTRVSGKPLKRDVTHSSCHDYNVPPYLITSISDGLCSSVALPRVKVTQAYKLVIISNSLCVLYEFWVYS